jgi:hypothetical protein
MGFQAKQGGAEASSLRISRLRVLKYEKAMKLAVILLLTTSVSFSFSSVSTK